MTSARECRFTLLLITLLLLCTVEIVCGDSLEDDTRVLQTLKSFLEDQNHVNRGRYAQWNRQDSSPCNWQGITCTAGRVTGIDLSNNDIYGKIFGNFSAISELTHLDLSTNSIGGEIPADLGRCQKLKYLNLSHNIIDSKLNLTSLNSIEILDLSLNRRIHGDIGFAFPIICNNLWVVNISTNNFTGEIGTSLDRCWNLQYVDLSVNNLSGGLGSGFGRLKEFVVSENKLSGIIPSWVFPENCSLEALDLSENSFFGEFPPDISNCKNLVVLNLWGNRFSGKIPQEIGSIQPLQALLLGNNSFLNEIPESLLGLRNLMILDLSSNNFQGDIQEIFGRFMVVKCLLLHDNSYTGGLVSSGLLRLPNITRLDLSYNDLSGPLPLEVSEMFSLKYLCLAHNQFTGQIPSEYGILSGLQALDLSSNKLSGSIPSSFGNLSSLLWLMLANNSLTGEIPSALGSCSSLLWLNLENNQLSGQIPSQLTNIGKNAMPVFLSNRQTDRIVVGAGECLAMRRWIPADYPPFSMVYTLLTRKNCISLWDKLLKGYGLFPICVPGSNIRTFQISGYLQLSSNRLSGEVPREISKMVNFSMLHLGINQFSGTLPKEIGLMSIVVLNISQNKFSGEIPAEVGNIKCLLNLDLSYNNFSGAFPTSLNNLTDLSKFNVSYNPYISGVIPSTGQLATFERWSYLGDPLLHLPSFIGNNSGNSVVRDNGQRRSKKVGMFLGLLALVLAILICGGMTFIVFLMVISPSNRQGYLLEDTKNIQELGSSSSASLSWLSDTATVKVIQLDKLSFTHADILMATGYFSEDKIIGKGGSGTVYRGLLPDGRQVAVKKIQREGTEGEREFRAEMEVLSGNGFGWPHPNLVTLYGWCIDDSEKLLVYEYMEGGSLEDLVADRTRLTWRKRINIAVDVARALLFLHHECYPAIVHRDVKASNVLLDKDGKARVTDFGLARVVNAGGSHVSTMVAGTVGYVAPEYGQTWQATPKGDVYSYGVFVMELATGRRAVDGGEECLVEWARRVMVKGRRPVALMVSGLSGGAEELSELLRIGIRCCADTPHGRPNMKQVLGMLVKIPTGSKRNFTYESLPSF